MPSRMLTNTQPDTVHQELGTMDKADLVAMIMEARREKGFVEKRCVYLLLVRHT